MLDLEAMGKILLVEDDPILGRGLSVNLELEGHSVFWAKTLKSAIDANAQSNFNLVLLDLGLPDGSGLSFCSRLREDGSRIPIIILTAQSDEDSVVEGLSRGANDYVRKPFGVRELMARVKIALGERVIRDKQIRYGDLMLLLDQRKAYFEDVEIELSRREFDLLSFLVHHAEAVVSRDRLIDALGNEAEIFDRTIDSHVSHIRSRLKARGLSSLRISSVYGVGYRLEKK